MTAAGNNKSEKYQKLKYSLDAPNDERKYRLKHVHQQRNNKLSYTAATFW